VTLLGQSVRLAQARRFAELGQLIGGIAHEIRNPLNAMRLNLHMLERYQTRDGHPTGPVEHSDELGSFDIIQETDREIQRVEELMKILLGYARPEQAHNEYISIATELDSTLRFLRPEMEGQDIRLRKHMPSEAVCVFMDRNRLRQIMLNLLNNAREAAGPGGEIDVSVECEAGLVRIEVSDNGPGVPPEDRERMFEPFFSTKELGTGLGLPLVKRFTEEAGGRVQYLERNAGGACFRLTLVEATPSTNADEPKQAQPANLETAVSQRG
jgi:signal transduction histidine kinase